jgi:hypothetical protein
MGSPDDHPAESDFEIWARSRTPLLSGEIPVDVAATNPRRALRAAYRFGRRQGFNEGLAAGPGPERGEGESRPAASSDRCAE